MPRFLLSCKAASAGLLVLGLCQLTALGEWQRDDKNIAWVNGTNVFWRFSFDTNKGKPFFHPVAPGGAVPLTNFKPSDHPWHYGLWFSWKYINHPNDTNHVNYWEEDKVTGQAQGKTRWDDPVIVTESDGRADIRMNLSYVSPSGHTDMTEIRELRVSAPTADGSFSIDWSARFTVGDEDVILDRTPLLGEPDGVVYGGYGGLSARMVPLPVTMSVVTSSGPPAPFVSNRTRPFAAAVGCNFSDGSKDIGGLAMFTDPANTGDLAPWYIISSQQMPFICEALLAPKPLTYAAHGKITLRYRVGISAKAWSQEALEAAEKDWMKQ